MDKNRTIDDKNLENVSGAMANGNSLRIMVEYIVSGKGKPNEKRKFKKFYDVEPDETIDHLETRVWRSCYATRAYCETFFNGAPVSKKSTIRMLKIKPYDTLRMNIEAEGGGW